MTPHPGVATIAMVGPMTETLAYKVLTYKVLTEADRTALEKNVFAGAPIDQADGYIHLSTASQCCRTDTYTISV
jgi:uncharacterized protein (DUF952 family)